MMNQPHRIRCAFLILAIAVSGAELAAGQSLEDAIEAELDQIKDQAPSQAPANKATKAPVPNAAAKPAVKAEKPAGARPVPLARTPREPSKKPIAGGKSGVYVVQSGDTLWEISKTLFGDGQYWTKLLAENPEIKDPNNLRKGQSIRYSSGNIEGPARIQIVEKRDVIEMGRVRRAESPFREPVFREEALKSFSRADLSNRESIEVEELVDQPELPPEKPRTPVLRNLPRSFVARSYGRKQGNYSIAGIDVGEERSRTESATAFVNSYILDAEPTAVGKVEEIEIAEEIASFGQSVYVRMSRPTSVGQRYTVIFPKGKIKDPNRGMVGPVVEVGGQIEITHVLDEDKGVFKALVVTSINPVLKNSLLIEGEMPKVKFERSGTLLNVDVRVIGGENDLSRKILGESSTVFLDGGAGAGLSVGDILPVQSQRKARRKQSKFPEERVSIGVLRIVRVEPTVATAVVVEANDEIVPGDRTGGALPEKRRPVGLSPVEATELD